MFDNMRPQDIKAAVKLLTTAGVRRNVVLEVSGGVNLGNLAAYGKTGADWISVGRLTNSAPAIDYTLHFI